MGLLGPDIFISYRKSEAPQYARALRGALESLGYRCFLDEDWQPPGYNIETYKTVARRSRMFVLIGSKTVLDSKHIPLELDAYDRGHAGWLSRHWRRIFPISVNGALAVFESAESGAPFRGTPWASLVGLVSEPETVSALIEGRPSEDIPKRIARTYGLVRGARQLLAYVAVAVVLALSATLFALRWVVRDAEIKLAQVNAEKEKAKADRNQAKEEARQQRLVADAYSRVDSARRLPEHDDFGNPNTGRMLSAVESWRVYPNPAAFQLMSQSLITLALPVKKWPTGLGELGFVAIDPKGQRVAASDMRMVKIFRRNGAPVFPGLKTEDGVTSMTFAGAGKELIVVVNENRNGQSGSEIIRLNAEDGSETGRNSLGPKYVVAMSSDGEWVAASSGQGVEVLPTRRQGPSKAFPYHSPCFVGSQQLVMLEDSADGTARFVSRNLQEQSSLPELNSATDLKFINIVACAEGWIIYSPATSGPVAYWTYDPKLSRPILWSPEHVVFGNDVMAGITPGASSHLFGRAKLGEWELVKYLSAANAIGFGPPYEFVTGDRNGALTIWNYSDPRQRADLSDYDILPGTLGGFEGNWAPVPYREPYFNSRLGNAGPLLSPDKRWKAERDTNSSVAVVDVASGYEILVLEDQFSDEGAFSADNNAFALRSALGVRVWSLDPEFYLRTLCRALIGAFDPNWNAPRYQNACQPNRTKPTGQ